MKSLSITWREFLTLLVDGIWPNKGDDPSRAQVAMLLSGKDASGADLREQEMRLCRERVQDLERQVEQLAGEPAGVDRDQKQKNLDGQLKQARQKEVQALDFWRPIETALEKVKGYKLGGVLQLRTRITDESTPDEDLFAPAP